MSSYSTVIGQSVASIIVKKSRFNAYVAPVSDGKDAKKIVQNIRKIERSAGHHAYAYIVGEDGMEQRFDDDGEPSGTAGAPILRALDTAGLTNTVVIVSRIFGGVKLGASGLSRAYGSAATEALKQATIIVMEPAVVMEVAVKHETAPRLQHFLIEQGYQVGMEATVKEAILHVVVRERDMDAMERYLRTATKDSATVSIIGHRHVPSE